jgi:tRNA A-37 threonylcarbamoyl transferase component Bud32
MPLSTGTKLGPYEILAPIGAGGMGEVYKARDTKLDREVAIKVLPPMLARDPERLARFEREAKVLASLNHPNIAQIHAIEEVDGIRALVMELVPGETLKGPLALPDALRVAGQIADALQAAHDKGITHRDLKPANIIITPQGVVKVLDFGLAKLAESAASGGEPGNSPTLTMGATQVGMVMGTAAYMSPEQARGQQDVDRRADIWAFGVVLYEMLTGQQLFQGSTLSDILAAVLKVEPDLNAAPVQVRPLLVRCLQKKPQKRLQAIGDWELLVDVGAGHVPPGIAHARPLPWIAAAALVVVSIALGVLLWRATRPVDHPLMRFSADLGPEAVEGPRIAAAISPDGTRLAFAARGPAGKDQLATRLLAQAQATLLPGTENAVDPFFSPDGQWIGFFADGKMKKISVQGGAAVALCDTAGTRGASWGEDGWIVLSPTITSGLSRVPEAGGTLEVITKPGEKGEVVHRWPQILPGGQAVLFTGHTVAAAFDNASIEVLSLKTGQWKVVQRGGYFGRYLPSGHLVYIHQGTLFAVGFDLDRLEVRGTAAPLLEKVAGNDAVGAGQYDVARNGTLVYLSGKSSTVTTSPAWMESTGKMQPLLASPGLYLAPRLSPDGKRLALGVGPTGGGDIQVYDWQRDTMTRLTFTQRNMYPVWTPDGKHLVFQSQSSGANSIRWIRADGAGEAQLLLESKGEPRPYSFSPDGQRLAYTELGMDTGFDLWTLPLDLGNPEHPKAWQAGTVPSYAI